jgi:ubiquinone/menaquinone biosynthesis C-methylase UbiE
MARIDSGPMIEAPVTAGAIQRTYDLWSRFYGSLVVPLEQKPRRRGLELAAIQPHDQVLEVAVGTGAALVEVLKRVDRANVVHGVDLSPRMLERARRAVARAGFTNVDLRQADARALPFDDGSFDLVLNSYMLDLIPLHELRLILGEFRRVLRDGGRLVLVNMSKDRRLTLYERLYRIAPARLVPYLFGGCRPVLMAEPARAAGFRDVRREFIPNVISSEAVTARK